MKETMIDTSVLNGLIDNVPHAIFWKDKNLAFAGCNKQFAVQFGYPNPADIIGKTDYDFPFPSHLREKYNYDDRQILTTGVPKLNYEEVQTQPDGSEKVVLVSKVPYYNQDNEIIGVLGIYTDITSLKQIEQNLIREKEKAEAANAAKTKFLENMRHDIRTPLTGIIGFSNLIKDEVQDEKIKEYAENLAISSHTLMDFLNDVLESIGAISENVPILKQKFDLKAKLEHVIQLNQAVAGDKKLSLTLDYDKKIPHYLVGDGKRIYRVILELVTNALKFTHKGGVKISAELAKINLDTSDAVIKLQVSDTGIGIADNQRQEIFTRFHRLNPSAKGTYKGLGMGLAIVKQFVEDLNAEIYVDSKPNQGSVFTCIIPLKKALLDDDLGIDNTLTAIPVSKTTPTLRLHTHKTTSSTAIARILLVEDHVLAAKAVYDLLRGLACQIDIAQNGQDALDCLKKNEYDLILMDVGLPDIDGCEITQRVRLKERGTAQHIPIIALTAHIDVENKQRCIEAGMDAVISKPLSKEKAQDILNAFIPSQEKQVPQQEENKILNLEGPVIDLALGAKIMDGDVDSAKKMITLLLENTEDDIKSLVTAHQNQDWITIRELAHKLRGGAAYCGTPRLYQALSNLNDYLKMGQRELAESLYRQALTEMEKVKTEFCG